MKNRKDTRWGCLIPIVLGIVLIAMLGLKGWQLYKTAQSLNSTQTRLKNLDLSKGIRGLPPAEIVDLIKTTRQDVINLKRDAGPFMFVTPYLGWLPEVGGLAAQSPAFLDFADASTSIAIQMLPTLQNSMTALQNSGTTQNDLAALTPILAEAQPDLIKIENDVQKMVAAFGRIEDRKALPKRVQEVMSLLDKAMPLAEDSLKLAQLAPEFLGATGRRHYLVIVQNEDELRGTGGFISGAGLLVVEQGNLISLAFESSDFINDVLANSEAYGYPPDPLLNYMGLEYFIFRDSNYWPDFPTSAENGIKLYKLGRPDNQQIDGVIAIDQTFARYLLRGIGPIRIESLNTIVTEDNLLEKSRASWSYESVKDTMTLAEWITGRKDFMGEFAQAAQEKLFNQPDAIDPIQLVNAILQAGYEKHLQIYTREPKSQQLLVELRLDGGFNPPTEQDSLLVADMNVGYNKANATTTREIIYRIKLNDTPPQQAETILRYQNNSTSQDGCIHVIDYNLVINYNVLANTCYWNYLRIYPAPNSSLLEAPTWPAPADYFITGNPSDGVIQPFKETFLPNREVNGFGQMMVLKHREQRETFYRYEIDSPLVQKQRDGSYLYQVTIYKQAGTPTQKLTVQVQLPDSAEPVTSLHPPIANFTPTTSYDRVLIFELELKEDTTIEVRYFKE